MAFPGFTELHMLSDPVASRPYRASYAAHERGVALSRGEAFVGPPVELTWAMGGAMPGDVVWSTSAAPLILHARVVDLLEKRSFTGWTTYPVSVVEKSGKIRSDYSGLGIIGRCAPVDLTRSTIGLREYPGGWAPEFEGHYFAPDSWDGSDLFMENAHELGGITMSRFVTEPLRHALEQAKVRGLLFTRLTDVRLSTSVITIGSPHRLPADYEARVAAAYARAGVPRPAWVR